MSSVFPEVILGHYTLKIGSGATPRGGDKVYQAAGSISLIRSQNVYNNQFERQGLVYISEAHARQLANVSVEAGDVLLNITGDSVARVCQAPTNVLPARVNQHVAIIRPNPQQMDATFLRYFLVSPRMQAHMLTIAGAGATRNALTKGMIEQFSVPHPPLSEQRTIAHILGSLDDKIELNRQMNQTLEEMAQAIFQSWFVDFDPVYAKARGEQPVGMDAATATLFPDSFDETELGLVPSGWRFAMLPDSIDVNPPRQLRKGLLAPYLDMANMPTHSARAIAVTEREFGSGMRFQNGDTLVARITPCLENGKTCFVDFLKTNEVGWGSTEYIVLHPMPPLVPTYAYYLARTEHFRAFAIANMTGTSGRQRVPAACFRQYPIVIPSALVSKAFGQLTIQFHDLMKANDEQSSTLAELRDTLLPKLMYGELRVPEAAEVVQESS